MVWPSYEMSEIMVADFQDADKESLVKSIGYIDAGHQFFWASAEEPEAIPSVQSLRLTGIKKHKFPFGGTKEGTREAMMASRLDVLTFLSSYHEEK